MPPSHATHDACSNMQSQRPTQLSQPTETPLAAALGLPLPFNFSMKMAPNRFMKGAMSERLCSFSIAQHLGASRGVPSEDLIHLYEEWGKGGIGVIVSGNIMIDHDHLEAAGNAVISKDAQLGDERFGRFARLATATKTHGSLVLGQVNHPGRQALNIGQVQPISASTVQLGMQNRFARPRAASADDLDAVVEGFAHAAAYLEEAGFDGIQLHGAHGYLIAQFLSPSTNNRTDEYGGSLENRARLITRIARAVRLRCSASFIMGIKINSVEFQKDGFTPAEARQLCQILERETFDFVEISGGTYERLGFNRQGMAESTQRREAYFIEFAEQMVPCLTNTRSYITGGFRTAQGMADALRVVDGIGLARPLCQEPHLCRDLLLGTTTAARRQRVHENDFLMSTQVAGAQMHQMGRGQAPIDMSVEENEIYFRKHMAASSRSLFYPKL